MASKNSNPKMRAKAKRHIESIVSTPESDADALIVPGWKKLLYYYIISTALMLCGFIPYLNLLLFFPLSLYYALKLFKGARQQENKILRWIGLVLGVWNIANSIFWFIVSLVLLILISLGIWQV